MVQTKTLKNLPLSSKEARGQRLKQLRALTGIAPGKPLTRAAIERKYGLSARTLRNWESGHGAGLTEGGARRIVDIYQKENIPCSISWLMHGMGSTPERPTQSFHQNATSAKIPDLSNTLESEQAYFKSLYPEGVTFEVKDDAMMPIYRMGDIVGGVRHYAHDIINLADCDCIIEVKTGEVYLRRLQTSTIPGQYNLYALNPSTKIERPTLYSVEILTAAPVVRHWRGKKWKG